MTKVQVVNRREIDGKERKRDEVIEVSPGQARDLISAGKARAVGETSKPVETAKTAEKGGK